MRTKIQDWICGLLGLHNSNLLINKLAKEVTNNGKAGFKATYINYENNESYECKLIIRKIDDKIDNNIKNFITELTIESDKDKIEKYVDYFEKP